MARSADAAPPLLVVVAVHREWEGGAPAWTTRVPMAPLYQRVDPSAPRYVPNVGFEAGAYLRFVVDNYAALPDVTVFLQADAHRHVHLVKVRRVALRAVVRCVGDREGCHQHEAARADGAKHQRSDGHKSKVCGRTFPN